MADDTEFSKQQAAIRAEEARIIDAIHAKADTDPLWAIAWALYHLQQPVSDIGEQLYDIAEIFRNSTFHPGE